MIAHPGHAYLSTACYHEQTDDDPSLHEACRLTCKFCDCSCSCPRHRSDARRAEPDGTWVGQARSIARELLELTLNAQPTPSGLLRRIEEDPALFWLRGEEQPPGTWRPSGKPAPGS